MISIIRELESLQRDLKANAWAPSGPEQLAAAQICAAPVLSHESICDALAYSELSEGRLFSVLEPTSAVLSLPPVHEDISRHRLDEAMWSLLREICTSARPSAGKT